jgi:FAD/FMN-containing dehydrogenase
VNPSPVPDAAERPSSELAADLAAIVGPDHVLTEPSVIAGYETDWTGRFQGTALLVVRPRSAEEVGAVLRACGARGGGVVPQGGNTGLVGGATPYGHVVLSTTRLDELGPVDEVVAEVEVGAGATLEAVQAHVAPNALTTGVDIAARGSATIGGMVATDAGGTRTVRHGTMRSQLVGIEAVLADGRLVRHDPRADADAGGVHLPSLLAGSEGTLGIVTRVRLRLVPRWRFRAVALVAFEDLASACAAIPRLRRSLPDLEAIEFVDQAGLALVSAHAGMAAPFRAAPAASVLVETAADRPVLDELVAALDGLPGLHDAVAADDGPDRTRLWSYRERVTEAIAAVGVPHKLDVGLPPATIPAFVAALGPAVVAAGPEARLVVFGHLAAGNLHVNVLGVDPASEQVDDVILQLVLAHGGSIGAEHGIGRAKARWLSRARSPGELAVQVAIKRALDPGGLLNPGVLDPGVAPAHDHRPGPDGR